MEVTVGLSFSDLQGFQAAVMSALADRVSKLLSECVPGVAARTREAVRRAIVTSPDYIRLTQGDMWHKMGLESPYETMDAIVRQIQDNVAVVNHGVSVRGNSLEGVLTIGILRVGFQDLLSLKQASFTSITSEGVTTEVDWLRWLLLEGTHLVVADYTYLGGPRTADYSRTNEGIMVPSRRGWSVPAEIAGTIHDNWLTRALGSLDKSIRQILEEEVTKVAY